MPIILPDGSTRSITGPDGLPIEHVDGSGNVLYYYQDQLGSTRGLLDGSGTTVATYTYDAYGNTVSYTGTATTPFQYAGQYTDAESGLQYLRARYYDPSTQQFLTLDPLTDSTSVTYSYAGDNPVNGVDPAGMCRVNSGSEPAVWESDQVGKCTAVITGLGYNSHGQPHYSLRIYRGHSQILNYHIYYAGGTPPALMRWRVDLRAYGRGQTPRLYPGRTGSNADQQSVEAAKLIAKSVQRETQAKTACGKNDIYHLIMDRGKGTIGILASASYGVYSARTGNDAVTGWCPLPPPFTCDQPG